MRPEIIQLTAMELTSTCMEFLAENKLTFDHVFKGLFNQLEEIQRINVQSELEGWIKEKFNYAIEFIRKNKRNC